MPNSASPLRPTYVGIVNTTKDALVLSEACLSGRLNHVSRRPHDRERSNLIKSGHIFVYEEHSSGIKRWTDGIDWSPSRVLGNFLVYRELNGSVTPGEKKRKLKNKSPTKPSSGRGFTKIPSRTSSSFNNDHWGQPNPAGPEDPDQELSPDERDPLRSLVGSLTDSYDFKTPNGLVKKTISIRTNGVCQHLVNYYSVEHALANTLRAPTMDANFCGMKIRDELYLQQGFRSPINADYFDEHGNGYVSNVVGLTPPLFGPQGPLPNVPNQLPPPMHPQMPHAHFDSFCQPISGQHPTQSPGQLEGGFSMFMCLPPFHAPSNYPPHSSFDSQVDGYFVNPLRHSNADAHPQALQQPDSSSTSYTENKYNPSQGTLPDGEPDCPLGDQYDYDQDKGAPLCASRSPQPTVKSEPDSNAIIEWGLYAESELYTSVRASQMPTLSANPIQMSIW